MKAKLENFWYHYKGITLMSIFIAIVLIIGFKSCADKTLPDLKILYFSDAYISATFIKRSGYPRPMLYALAMRSISSICTSSSKRIW